MSIKINVYALWRDSSEHISRSLAQLAALTELKHFEFRFFFYENDSQDGTLKTLNEWRDLMAQKGVSVDIITEVLHAPKFGSVPSNVRTSILSYYRNKNKLMGKGVESDYSLVVDSDLEWTTNDFMELFGAIRLRDSTVMATSNCRQNVPDYVFGETDDSYYDVYCLRDKWGNGGIYFANAPFYSKADNERFLAGAPVEVKSGFGGLALIRSSAFNQVQWSADLHSEHVNFCYDLGNFGKILAVPTSKPFATVDLARLNLDKCREIAQSERQNYEHGNQLRQWSVDSKWNFGRINMNAGK